MLHDCDWVAVAASVLKGHDLAVLIGPETRAEAELIERKVSVAPGPADVRAERSSIADSVVGTVRPDPVSIRRLYVTRTEAFNMDDDASSCDLKDQQRASDQISEMHLGRSKKLLAREAKTHL
nr:hypothetical protein CFP56_78551 [Quercus suber]